MIEEYVCVFTFVFVRLFFGEPCYILSESVKPVFSRCLIARFVRGCNYYPRIGIGLLILIVLFVFCGFYLYLQPKKMLLNTNKILRRVNLDV